MLVLSRKVGQKIQVGNDVTVEVLRVRGGQVRLGVTAPDHKRILRSELEEKSDGENSVPKPG